MSFCNPQDSQLSTRAQALGEAPCSREQPDCDQWGTGSSPVFSLYRRQFTLGEGKGGFALELGGRLPSLVIAYESYGHLSPRGDNVILITHALTGDSHVASHGIEDRRPGWWEGMVGPGRPLDTDRYFLICSNVLGGCQGTTGPGSLNPTTGAPYATDFPIFTVRDMVRAQHRFLQALGIRRLHSVIGGSLGGMQALQWAVTFPGFSRSVIAIGTPGRTSPQSIAFNEVGRQAIMSDPEWEEGRYYPRPGPRTGLSIARMLGMITYQSQLAMERKFGRRPVAASYALGKDPAQGNSPGKQALQSSWPWHHRPLPTPFAPTFAVESYLHRQGEKLVQRFDANSYLYLTRAMDLFDLGRGYAGYREALAGIRARSLVIGIDTDILYPVREQRELVEAMQEAGVDVSYQELVSPWGHDAFLIEFDQLGTIIRNFLSQLA
ncbi:MAG: homoserine O-acetyltransferase [Firmicutes bacterium]|nr:homoserine O-acetyltransferase [Bacillota bacterium]